MKNPDNNIGKNEQLDIFSSKFPANKNKESSELWLLTNRNNLLEILSSGLIKPRILYPKYYDDPGAYCPNAIPLFTNKPTIDFVEVSCDREKNDFPVLLQIDPDFISGKCKLITEKYDSLTNDMPKDLNGILCVIIKGALPFSAVKAIGFRNEQEFLEFKLRKFENVPDKRFLMHVMQDFYSAIELENERLINLIKRSFRKSSVMDKLSDIPDKLGGSLLLITKFASIHPDFQPEDLIEILQLLQNPGNKKNKNQVDKGFTKESWISGITHILSDKFFVNNLSEVKQITEDLDNSCLQDPQEMLFRTAVEKITEIKKDNYSNEIFILNIEEEISKQWHKYFDEKQTKALMEEFGVIKKVINSEVLVEDYYSEYNEEEHRGGYALTNFMLRNKPSSILNSIHISPHLSHKVLAMSLILSGILHGRARVPVENYPDENMKSYIDYINAQYINFLYGSQILPELSNQFSVRETEEGGVSLKEIYNNKELLLLIRPAEIISESGIRDPHYEGKDILDKNNRDKSNDDFSIETSSSFSEAAAQLTPEKIRERLIEKDLTDASLVESQIAVEICIHEGWFNLITSIIPLMNKDFYLEHHKAKKEFRIRGYVEPVYTLNNQKEFKFKLDSLDENYFSELCKTKLEVLISQLNDNV